jgi:hypothetical protein
MPETDWGKTMKDIYGRMSFEPLAVWDRDSLCWKTSADTCLWGLPLSYLTLPQWGSMRNGELWERQMSAHHITENGYLFSRTEMLPTPTAEASKHGSTPDVNANPWGKNLWDIPHLLPTPAVNHMGEGKTLEWWEEWAPRQKAADGRPVPHGKSLAIEAQRISANTDRPSSVGKKSLNDPHPTRRKKTQTENPNYLPGLWNG